MQAGSGLPLVELPVYAIPAERRKDLLRQKAFIEKTWKSFFQLSGEHYRKTELFTKIAHFIPLCPESEGDFDSKASDTMAALFSPDEDNEEAYSSQVDSSDSEEELDGGNPSDIDD